MPETLKSKGFTLIEILVVVVIIAVITATSYQLLSSGSIERKIQNKIHNLRAALNYSCNQAVFQNTIFGLHLFKTGYHFSSFQNQSWLEINSEQLPETELDEDWKLTLLIEDDQVVLSEKAPEIPQIICHPSGETNQFAINLSHLHSLGELQFKSTKAGKFSTTWVNDAE